MHSKNNQYEIKQSKYASFCFVIYNNKRNMKIFSLKRYHFEIYTIFYVTIYYTEEKKMVISNLLYIKFYIRRWDQNLHHSLKLIRETSRKGCFYYGKFSLLKSIIVHLCLSFVCLWNCEGLNRTSFRKNGRYVVL